LVFNYDSVPFGLYVFKVYGYGAVVAVGCKLKDFPYCDDSVFDLYVKRGD